MRNDKLRLRVSEEFDGLRLDIFCSRRVADRTRSYFTKLAAAGNILLDGEPAKPSHKVKAGMSVTVLLTAPPPLQAKPEKIDLDIVYEDERIIVIDKRAGMVVHPAAGNYEGTLVSALLYHFGELARKREDQIRPGIVHRLDKDTSGLIVAARDGASLAFLQARLKERVVKRTYLALLWGNIENSDGVIDLPIGRNERDRKKMSVYARYGREATTMYEVEERFGLATLARITLKTGRTHQIRVHMSHFGHPVVGDPTYRGRSHYLRRLSKSERITGTSLLGILSRQALHATELQLPHPDDGRIMNFTSPLPEDMKTAVEFLRSNPLSGGR